MLISRPYLGQTYRNQNWKGYCWTGTLHREEGAQDDDISEAKEIDYDSGGVGRSSSVRTIGLPIRPVINLKETGIDDIEYKQTIRMAYHNGSIELSSIEDCDNIDILNICGQRVFSSPVTAKSICVPQFSKGIYLCILTKKGKSIYTQKIIIK